jgi:uncharacterized protein (DUF1501 family)
LSRRLVEAGVKFVQVNWFRAADEPMSNPCWDSHVDETNRLKNALVPPFDRAYSTLLSDLKQRGLLDSTVVLWSGEFGRLPVSQNGSGRDHNRNAFSLFLAGGGFKAGHVHGATDDVGYKAAVDRVSVPDLHATILNQLGLDHQTVTYEHSGRDESLTDASLTGAKVINALIKNAVA